MSQFHTLTPSLGPGKREEGKLHSSKWATQRRRGGGEHRDGWLVCFDVRLKSTVPVVLRASSLGERCLKSVCEIRQVMLTDQNALGFPVYASNVYRKHVTSDVDKYLQTDRSKDT